MSTRDDDLIRDILARVLAIADGFTEAQALQIEEQVRYDRRGEDYYVAGHRNARRAELKHAAVEAVEQGMRPEAAAKKHGLGRATIYRLLKRD